MNLYQRALMGKPSLQPGWCVICGDPCVTGHHIVPRSQGGADGPVIHLCGHGTIGHHGKAEDKQLHFRWRDQWEYLETSRPTRYEAALEMDGWRECAGQ